MADKKKRKSAALSKKALSNTYTLSRLCGTLALHEKKSWPQGSREIALHEIKTNIDNLMDLKYFIEKQINK